jgi:hypothetical protein
LFLIMSNHAGGIGDVGRPFAGRTRIRDVATTTVLGEIPLGRRSMPPGLRQRNSGLACLSIRIDLRVLLCVVKAGSAVSPLS